MKTRVELKYLVQKEQALKFLSFLKEQKIILQDSYADPISGKYTIESLYYDTPADDCLWDSIEGYPLRRKVRIRHYRNESYQIISKNLIELKSKTNQFCNKKRALINGEPKACITILKLADQTLLGPWIPAVVVEYERYPFILSSEKNIRVTLDINVRAKHPHDFAGPHKGITFLRSQYSILEIKGSDPHAIRSFHSFVGQHMETHPTRFSKYCLGVLALRPSVSPDYWASYQNYLEKPVFDFCNNTH